MSGNSEYLRTINAMRSSEEARANGQKGGIASGISRRRKRTMREGLVALLGATEPNEDIRRELETLGVDTTVQNAILYAVGKRAIEKGDPEAARFIRDTVGERPSSQYEVSVSSQSDLRTLSNAELERLVDEVVAE